MCNHDCFETLLGFGNAGEAMRLNHRTLDIMGIDPALGMQIGLLTETSIGSTVECAGCEAYIPVQPRQTGDGIALFADCPECGVYRLSTLECKLWQVDFSPLLEAARTALCCSGKVSELIPGSLWNLGRSALAGQSREVFACAGINTVRNKEILPQLPLGKTQILLVIGNAPRPEKLGAFSPDRVFLFADMAYFDGEKICFDVSGIQSQLGILPALDAPAAQAPGRNSKIGDLTIKLKTELRQYMLGNYSAVMQSERGNREFDFPELKQSDLARMLNVPRVYIKRAIEADLELKTLFASANNRNSTMAYGHKAKF